MKSSNLFFRRPGVAADEGLEPEPATDAGVLRRIDLEQYWDLPRTANDWGGMTTLTPWIEAALYRPLTADHLSIAEHATEGLNFAVQLGGHARRRACLRKATRIQWWVLNETCSKVLTKVSEHHLFFGDWLLNWDFPDEDDVLIGLENCGLVREPHVLTDEIRAEHRDEAFRNMCRQARGMQLKTFRKEGAIKLNSVVQVFFCGRGHIYRQAAARLATGSFSFMNRH